MTGQTPPPTGSQLSPALFFDILGGYQRSAALKGAIELDLFTGIGEGAGTAAELAARCGAAERGTRILCDYLVVLGFLNKQEDRYGLTPDTAAFLDRRSPAYLGGAAGFLLSPQIMAGFADLAAAARRGGTVIPQDGTVAPDHPVWVNFAESMAPVMAPAAEHAARLVLGGKAGPMKVLDVAAGHGRFGLAYALQNPAARVVALDWANVVEVAARNAKAAGVADRFSTLPGSAFEVDYGDGYDLILLPNFLHHFSRPACETLLRKVRAALAGGGRAVTVEFIPDEGRVTPPAAASFALTMLATTPEGDAYTFAEYDAMFRAAGFARSELHELPPTTQRVMISYQS